jgi:glycosyltransferase involved in cell wall biosynthesis
MTTYNGEKTLPRVLDAYCALEPPDGGWKLCAVDNASTDATAQILRSYVGRLPLTCLSESRRGQNCARNSALGAVSGDLVVFSDDDAIPKRDWLAQLRRAADANPGFAIFGGTILPRWESEPEEWILRCVPPGRLRPDGPGMGRGLIRPSWVFSPNMAIRAEVFRAGHRFERSSGLGKALTRWEAKRS